MALIGTFFLFVLGVISAAVSRLLADEFKAWNPLIVRRLIERAVAQLPRGERKRFKEEWSGYVNEVPGEIGKLLAAFGFSVAAREITATGSRTPMRFFFKLSFIRLLDLLSSGALIVSMAPTYLALSVATKLTSGGPILAKREMVGRRGRIFHLYKFHVAQETSFGRLMHRFDLDALPMLFNVLKGDMSLIGDFLRKP